jgi:hypothetical protein
MKTSVLLALLGISQANTIKQTPANSPVENVLTAIKSKDTSAAPAAVKKFKNHDSSDDEVTSSVHSPTTEEKKTITEKQADNKAKSIAATAASSLAGAKAEAALTAANALKNAARANLIKANNAAKEAATKALEAEEKAAYAIRKAKNKVATNGQEARDLSTKSAVRSWEESVVTKHEMWKTYKSIKNSLHVATANAQLVHNNLKVAQHKLVNA